VQTPREQSHVRVAEGEGDPPLFNAREGRFDAKYYCRFSSDRSERGQHFTFRQSSETNLTAQIIPQHDELFRGVLFASCTRRVIFSMACFVTAFTGVDSPHGSLGSTRWSLLTALDLALSPTFCSALSFPRRCLLRTISRRSCLPLPTLFASKLQPGS
jgi:hypothetical protein